MGNNSLFSIFNSIDGYPGPVKRRLIAIDKYNKFISYPPTNPFAIWTVMVAPIINIMNKIEDTLVNTPIIKTITPITIVTHLKLTFLKKNFVMIEADKLKLIEAGLYNPSACICIN